MDVIQGRLTQFMRRDELEAAWAWVEPILDGWNSLDETPQGLHRRHLGPGRVVGADGARRRGLARRGAEHAGREHRLARPRRRAGRQPAPRPTSPARLRDAHRRSAAARCSRCRAGARRIGLFCRRCAAQRLAWPKVTVDAGRRALRAARPPGQQHRAGARSTCCRAAAAGAASCRSSTRCRRRRIDAGAGRPAGGLRSALAPSALAAGRGRARHGRRTATPPRCFPARRAWPRPCTSGRRRRLGAPGARAHAPADASPCRRCCRRADLVLPITGAGQAARVRQPRACGADERCRCRCCCARPRRPSLSGSGSLSPR